MARQHDTFDLSTGLSVLLPVYFRDASVEHVTQLRRAIESVISQDGLASFEIVLIDDGSTTPVASHTNFLGAEITKPIRWIRCERNGGLAHALNIGLRVARFPLIGRLDADDCWGNGKIKKQIERFVADPDLSLVATGMTRLKPSGEIVDRLIRPGDWRGILRFFVEVGCPFPHGSVVARKDIYQLLGGYPQDATFAHCEDFALWSIWLRFFKPETIEELLYNYTVSPTSVSSENAQQQVRATDFLRSRFAGLNLTERLPQALSELGALLGMPLLNVGALCYRMWQHVLPVWLPRKSIEPLRTILCDRDVDAAPDLEPIALRVGDVLFDHQPTRAPPAGHDTIVIARSMT
jgi:glycosyltransferase involved in cell wall biosynthesis